MKAQKNYVLIYNYAQHYRKSIFKKMDDNLAIDFYFGDYLDWAPDIKKMSVEELKGFKKELKNIRFFKYFIWQKGSFKAVFNKKCTHVLLYGDAFYISNWLILIYCRLFNKKAAIWTHGLYKEMKGITKLFNITFYKLSNYVFLYGNYSKNKMINLGFSPSKLLVIYNSLDYEKQIEIRNELNSNNIFINHFENNKPVFLYIGRIQKIKKLDMVIYALEKLKNTEFEFNFAIIGEDKEGVGLEKLVFEKKVEKNIWFHGACYDEKIIGNLIFNAVACISPGNIGLTAMHSMVYGTPAITHNNFANQMPEFEAIEENITGGFFDEDDVESLIKVIKIWIDKSQENKENIRNECFSKIDTYYNPNYQLSVIKSI